MGMAFLSGGIIYVDKYCFVIIESLNRAPYIKKYLEVINCKYDIVIWDRSANSKNPSADKFYDMHYKDGQQLSKIDKLFGYIKFSQFASRILKQNDYKGIFVFTPNVGILCYHVLVNKYKNRFLLDIRDYWQEEHKAVYMIEKGLVKQSFANIISSSAYKTFLPPADYIVTHNSQVMDKNTMHHFREKGLSITGPITIACIGAIKRINYDKKVIDFFANDDRFFLKFIGKGYDQLKEYCEQHNIFNVYTEGMFPMEETFNKYEGVDMILNMYGNHTPKLDYALSNKLYFAAQLGRPIVVCNDTFMEKVATDNGFGIAVDLDDKRSKDRLFEYYNGLDYRKFLNSCDMFLNKVREDENNFVTVVKQFTE